MAVSGRVVGDGGLDGSAGLPHWGHVSGGEEVQHLMAWLTDTTTLAESCPRPHIA